MAVRVPGAGVEGAADLEGDGVRRRPAPPVHDALDPGAVLAERPVGIGRVQEAGRDRRGSRPALLGRPILRAARRVGEVALQVERGQESIALGDPLGRARLEVEHVPQEVLGRRVLVQPADEIRDRAVEVLGPHDRGIEEEAPGARLDRPRLVIGHPLQHLELDPRRDAVGLPEGQAVGDVEEVVAGDAEVHGLRMPRLAAELDHALVVGVHLRLRLVRRLRPAVRGALDALHREVRALHDAELDGRASVAPTRQAPTR